MTKRQDRDSIVKRQFEHAQSPAQEIAGNLGDLGVAGQVELTMGANGFVDRVGKPVS